MKQWLIAWLSILSLKSVQAQHTVTLTQCYEAARTSYPLFKQIDVLQQAESLTLANLQTNRRLPQLGVNGQASWQSEVTQLPIELPNVRIPVLSKDQYRLTLDASYPLYDGGLLALQRDLQRANTAVSRQQVEVELNRLKDQVNTFFLNALLTDETIRLTQLLLDDLQNRLDKLSANVRFGTAAQVNVDALQAEQLRSEQRQAELNATRRGLRASLALLTGLSIGDSTRLLIENQPPVLTNLSLARPELKLYDAQRSILDAQLRLTDNRFRPRLSAFAQGGFGRPGLNFLNNDFRGLFIGGLRLNWNLSSGHTLRNERQLLALNRQTIDSQRAAFEKNMSVQLRQQQTDIERIQAQLAKDQAIVTLRTKVRQSAAVQFDNGVIAARDYTTELNNENQALLNQRLHELQLLLARIQYQTLTGN